MLPPSDLKILVAQRVRQHRATSEMTQRELAERSGLRKATISDIERAITTPDLGTAWRIADAFGISLDDLVGRSRDRRKRLFCAGRRSMLVQMAPLSAMWVSIDEAATLNYELVRRTVRTVVVSLEPPNAERIASTIKCAAEWFDSDIIWMADSCEEWPIHEIADFLLRENTKDDTVEVYSLSTEDSTSKYSSAADAYEHLFKAGVLILDETNETPD